MTAKKEAPAARGRGASLPMPEYLTIRLAEAGLTNREFAEKIGYASPNVVAMLKNGSMKLPLNRVKAIAKAIGVDPLMVLQKQMEQSSPELWDALNDIIGTHVLSDKEAQLLTFVRKRLDGTDPDFAAYPALLQAMAPELDKIREREVATKEATLALLRADDVRSGPKTGRMKEHLNKKAA